MRVGLKLAERVKAQCKLVGQTFMKKSANTVLVGSSLRTRLSRWWSTHSVAAPGPMLAQGSLAAICFVALVLGMPILFSASMERQDDLRFRERNAQLAKSQDAGEVLRADAEASALLQHDWLRSVEYSLERDPSSALSQHAAYERDQAALSGLESFKAIHMARAEDMAAQTQCLAQAVYYEARSESTSGQLAVAEVIMNRVLDHRYPNSVCDVVFQGATRTTGCQFTFTCDGAMRKQPRGKRWDKASLIASHVMMGLNETKTSGATHYHATYVNPVWNSGLVKTRQIDTHIFYRFPRGSEWASVRARLDRRMAQRASGLSTLTPASAPSTAKASVIKSAPPAAVGPTIASDVPVETKPETPATTAEIDAPKEISVADTSLDAAPVIEPAIDLPASGG